MREPTTKTAPKDECWDDPLLVEIRPVVREAIEDALEKELNRALGARWYARDGSRAGHRNGSVVREIGTPLGQTEVAVPRAAEREAPQLAALTFALIESERHRHGVTRKTFPFLRKLVRGVVFILMAAEKNDYTELLLHFRKHPPQWGWGFG